MTAGPGPHGPAEHSYIAARRRSIDPGLDPGQRREALAELQELRRRHLGPIRTAQLDDQLLDGQIEAARQAASDRAIDELRRRLTEVPAPRRVEVGRSA